MMNFFQRSQLMLALGFVSFVGGASAQQQSQASTAGLAMQQQTAELVGVQRVVDKAITTHPEVMARYQDFVSSLEGTNIARAGWKPQITASGWVGKEWRAHQKNNAPSYNWGRPGWSLELRQLIFDGGATSNQVRQLGFEQLSKYYDLQATSNSLANEAVTAYLDVQRYRDMIDLAKDNYALHERTLVQLRERQQSGVGRGVDFEQASGRLALAQTNLMTESNNLNDVTQRYVRLVGEYPQEQLAVVPNVVEGLPVLGETKSFEDAVRVNPVLLSKQALVQAAESSEKVAKAAFSPTVDFRAATGRDRDQPSNGDPQSSRVQLMMTYPLYRGGADSARVRQTAAQSYAAQDVRDYTCRNVQQELSVTWNNIQRLRHQLPFLKEHELATAKVRVAFLQQFNIGQRSLLDLLDTENELFDARRARVNAEYDLKKAEYSWLTLSNKVLPTLGLVQPHSEHEPEELANLNLPDEPLLSCVDKMPDTKNLMPVAKK